MATPTGSIGGTTVSAQTSSPIQTALVQQALAAAALSPTTSAVITTPSVAGVSTQLAANTPVVISTANNTNVTGGGGNQQAVFSGQSNSYNAGTNSFTTATFADGGNNTFVTTNPTGAAIAVFGSGANAAAAFGAANVFVTNANGADAILLAGTANAVDSFGRDSITIIGQPVQSNSVTLESSAQDSILLTGGANVTLQGSGSAVVQAGANSVVQASAATGNVTLTAGLGGGDVLAGTINGTDTFNFVRNSAGGADTVLNFGARDTLQLSGYGLNGITSQTTSTTGVTLTLSDNTQITLANVTSLNANQIKLT